MNALALVIGNGDYPGSQLKNPVNDAKDISQVLKRLGFFSRCYCDITIKDLTQRVGEFGASLRDYDIGLFYFAGHGMQIDGENFITAVDTDFDSEVEAKFSSVTLNKVLSYMERSGAKTNILILDACRNNPYERAWKRGVNSTGLAPMHAPKGTLIAYATSPGETASDGSGRNGLYTRALLKHIEDENISVEELFKRVRNSAYAFSNGSQTSWEHTSLTGSFKFNSGQLVHSIKTPYSKSAIADRNFKLKEGDQISDIIANLKTRHWPNQNPAVRKALSLDVSLYDKNALFVLGRNLLQTAIGEEFQAQRLMNNIELNAKKFSLGNKNHVLDGILYEIYFDSYGKLREKKFKSKFIDSIFELESKADFKSSFKFIKDQLKPFAKDVFYIPGRTKDPISFEIILKPGIIKMPRKTFKTMYVEDIRHEGRSVLLNDKKNPFFGSDEEPHYESFTYDRLKGKISELTSIPQEKLRIIPNHDLKDDEKIQFPFGYVIQKVE